MDETLLVLQRVINADALPISLPGNLLYQLRERAEDIQQMRPYLRRNFKSENVRLEICGGVVASWVWDPSEGIGVIPIASVEEALIGPLDRKRLDAALYVRSDGLLGSSRAPWLHLTQGSDPLHLQASFHILDAVHARLMEFYAKVDSKAVFARYLASEATSQEDPEEAEEEALEASLELALEAEEPDPERQRPRLLSNGRLRSRRYNFVRRHLERHFGCEVGSGKGSEVSFYRPGYRKYTLAHHKKDPEIPGWQLQQILKRLGIQPVEWFRSLGLVK